MTENPFVIILIVVAVFALLIFFVAKTTAKIPSHRSIINDYKPIEMPKYTYNTTNIEVPLDKSVMIVPDNLTTEIFTRTNAKAVKKEGAKAEKIFKKTKLGPKTKKEATQDVDANAPVVVSDNFNLLWQVVTVDTPSQDDDSRKNVSCDSSVYSKSCESPVESSSGYGYDSPSSSDFSSTLD